MLSLITESINYSYPPALLYLWETSDAAQKAKFISQDNKRTLSTCLATGAMASFIGNLKNKQTHKIFKKENPTT